jgi:hypothetical protein
MRLLSILMIVLLSMQVTSQSKMHKTRIEWGNELKAKNSTLDEVVAVTEDGIYVIKYKRKSLLNLVYIIEHYNNKLNLVNSKELKLEYDGKELYKQFTMYMNNELYIFSSFQNQKKKANYLFVQSLNLKTLTPNKDLKMIAEIDYSGFSKYNSGSFKHHLSPDSSKLLIYYDKPYDKGAKEKFGLHVYNSSMEEIWSAEYSIPYVEELCDIEQTMVSDAGDVYMLASVYKEKRKAKRKGKPNYQYHVLKYSDKAGENEYVVESKKKFLTDMRIAIAADNNIICAGFYSEMGTYSIGGSYYMRIDSKTEEVIASNYYEFGVDFITMNLTERQEKKVKKKVARGNDVEMYEYDLRDIVLRDDGGILLTGEQYYVRVVTTTTSTGNGGTTTTTTYYYYYNDIIVINISPEGIIEWTTKVPKRQVSTNDGGFYSSYTMAIVEDKLYFVFNDNARNLNYKQGDVIYPTTYGGKNAIVVAVMVDMEGNQARKALFNKEKADVIIRPKVCEQISSNEVLLFGQRRKTHQFARLIFE